MGGVVRTIDPVAAVVRSVFGWDPPEWALDLARYLYCDGDDWGGLSAKSVERVVRWAAEGCPQERAAAVRAVLGLAGTGVEPPSLRMSLKRQALEVLVEGRPVNFGGVGP